MAMLASRQTASTLALMLLGLFFVPAAQAAPLSTARAPGDQSAVIQVDHDWDDDDDYDDYYSRRYYRRHYVGRPYYGRPYYGYGYGSGYGYDDGYRYDGYRYYGRRRVTVHAPFAAVRVRPRGVYVRAPFVRLWVPRY
ncbi:hypothetical protein [Hyphomicrobium sp.]|uniref:hypothetical protein n=1 Tax=Hyphomicrobium sp. TaxID=82 RepID=UPI003F6E907B